jgi:hypothetical protein
MSAATYRMTSHQTLTVRRADAEVLEVEATEGARAIWQTSPALRTEQFFAGMDAAQSRGGSLLDILPVARAHAAEIRFTKPPAWLQDPLFAALSLVVRLRRR